MSVLLRAQTWRLVCSLAPFVCFLGSYACARFIREKFVLHQRITYLIVDIGFLCVIKYSDTNESDRKFILLERRFDVILHHFSRWAPPLVR